MFLELVLKGVLVEGIPPDDVTFRLRSRRLLTRGPMGLSAISGGAQWLLCRSRR